MNNRLPSGRSASASIAASLDPLGGLPRKRILIADENASVTEVLAGHLKDRYEVEVVLDGHDAISAVILRRPDLVFLDVNMTRASGVVVLKHIKTIDPNIPVVMVTADPRTNIVADALRIGAFGYMPKPFDFRYLDHLVAMAFKPTR